MKNLLRTIRAVLWSFIGIRDNTQGRKDSESVNLLTVVCVAFVAVILFIAVLMFIANLAVTNAL